MAGAVRGHTWLGVWKELDLPTRRQIAAVAFDEESLAKAMTLALARHDRIRRQTVEKWPVEKRADHFARMRKLPSAQLAAAMLSRFHLTQRRELVSSFLDFLKIPHKGGHIQNIDEQEPPPRSRMVAAIRRMAASFPRAHVKLFLDVVSCQSNFDVFADFDSARIEALGDPSTARAAVKPRIDSFSSPSETPLHEQPEPSQPEAPPPVDDTPPTFTTLDQMLIRSAVAAVADVHGALPPEKVEDLVEEVIQLNLERHQSYFHRGFLTVLLKRPLELDFPEASDVRRGWYACGAIVGFKRHGDVEAIVDLLTKRAEIARELSRPGTGYAERLVSIVFQAFAAKGRYAEAARFLSPEVVARSGVEFARELLDTASVLIRERREADARRLLDVLLAALPVIAEDPDLPSDFEVLLQRRRAHCARLRGDFEAARKLLEPQLEAATDSAVRSDILADLGLIECGLRSLADVRLPPEESMLVDFGEEFRKGWKYFEGSSKAASGGRSHGDFCIGMALFARAKTAEAIPYLERAVAGMSADPDRYGRFGPLDSARLALAVALAEQTDLARVPYARDLLSQVLDARSKIPEYMLRRALGALELTDPDIAIELAHEVHRVLGSRVLDVLADTRLIRFVPGALAEMLAQAKRTDFSPALRWRAARVVLTESHAMRDAPGAEGPQVHRERATEALDTLIELATEEPFRDQMIELLANDHGPWRTAMEPLDARVVLAALYESQGNFANAANELARAFHQTLDVDDEWALGKAEALLEDIRALGGDAAIASLEPRLIQYKQVFERRSQSGLLLPPSMDPEDFYGLVLIVGGNETQSVQDDLLVAGIKKHWSNVTLMFERTGWNSNWGDQLRAMEAELARARCVVIMRFVRTMLGKALRKRCNELEIPWVACTGSGRTSMMRAIEQAILLAWRQTGVAHAGQ